MAKMTEKNQESQKTERRSSLLDKNHARQQGEYVSVLKDSLQDNEQARTLNNAGYLPDR